MKITVVSTFRAGLHNVGDYLITKATIDAINHLSGGVADVTVLFRGERWNHAKGVIENSDFVIFACLALRRNMTRYYAFLSELMSSGIPYGILSAGTSLNVSSTQLRLSESFNKSDIETLLELARNASFFTTRGALSQAACENIGIENSEMKGDIAFFDPRFDGRLFQPLASVSRIAVSDPHYAERYENSLEALVRELHTLFPSAQLEVVLHGVNNRVKEWASEQGLVVCEAYKDRENGLDVYDSYDLHVGYRIHGHVSALNRRIPSYLLEQDGRGADYGLTIERKIAIPHYRSFKTQDTEQASTTSVSLMAVLIAHDYQHQFGRFMGLEHQIRWFVDENLRILKRALEL